MRHVAGSENHDFTPKVGVRSEPDDPVHGRTGWRTTGSASWTPSGATTRRAVSPVAGRSQFLVRRTAHHVLDHDWELEDRDLPPVTALLTHAHGRATLFGDHVRMSDDHDQRTDAAQAILDDVGGLTPGEARRLAIRHSDAFSPERQAARVRARAVARELGLLVALDALIRAAARLPDLPAVPERSQDAVRQVATDAAVVALLGEDLDEESRTLLTAPWARATRRRRSVARSPTRPVRPRRTTLPPPPSGQTERRGSPPS